MAFAIPHCTPKGQQFIYVAGGENLFDIASRYLGDPAQWWRIAALNGFPGQPPDFIVQQNSVTLFPILLLPVINANASPLN